MTASPLAAMPADDNLSPSRGSLYLVPTPLDFGCAAEHQHAIEDVLPAHTLQIASELTHWITENAKSTRAFLKRVNAHRPLKLVLQSHQMVELPREVHKKGDHAGNPGIAFDARPLLAPALAGHNMGLTSEAGMPAVADPGSSVVRAAHALGIPVQAMTGPSSLLLALAASGLNGQQFAFVGYLPQEGTSRANRLRELEALALRTGQTQLFIETPYRNTALLHTALQTLKPQTRLAVSCGLMVGTPQRPVHFSTTVSAWRACKPSLDWSLPTVFLIGV